jgi:hypothetical protein
VAGVIKGIIDMAASFSEGSADLPLRPLTVLFLCTMVIVRGCTEPQVRTATPSTDDWSRWGIAWAPMGVTALALVVGSDSPEAGQFLGVVSSFVLALCSIGIVVIAGIDFSQKQKPTTIDDLALAATVLALAGFVINPFKYVEVIGAVVGILDMFGGAGAAFCNFEATGQAWDN